MTNSENIDVKAAKLKELAEKANIDNDVRMRINKDPLEVMKSLDIEVDDEFKEVVVNQIKALTVGRADIPETEPMPATLKAPSPPTHLRVQAQAISEESRGLIFRASTWGLVLEVPQSVLASISSGGITIAVLGKALLTALSKLAESLKKTANPVLIGILAIAALWCGIQAGWILIEIAAINLANQKYQKGVYLTWTWFGLAMTCYLPIVTPIKK